MKPLAYRNWPKGHALRRWRKISYEIIRLVLNQYNTTSPSRLDKVHASLLSPCNFKNLESFAYQQDLTLNWPLKDKNFALSFYMHSDETVQSRRLTIPEFANFNWNLNLRGRENYSSTSKMTESHLAAFLTLVFILSGRWLSTALV